MRAVLTYHSIDNTRSPISILPESFASHVQWLASGRVRVLALGALVAEARAGDESLGDAVAITFDDGFANFAEFAAPLLAKHGLPSTVFVVSDHVGRTNAWGGQEPPGIPTLPLMTWDQLGRVAEGGVELGAHTRSHPALDMLLAQALADEIDGSADDIVAQTGVRPTTFAYPYGLAPAAAVAQVRKSFAVGVSTELRVLDVSDEPARIPRLDAFYLRQPDGLAGWGTARFRAYVRLRAAVRSAREQVRRSARFGAA
ncbi:MAG: polysaccharide deacetylase family protein [bacterium]